MNKEIDMNVAKNRRRLPQNTDAIVDLASYLAWRAGWRARYAAASAAVRAEKRLLADLIADRRTKVVRQAGTESYEYRINSSFERLPWTRSEASILMRERRAADARRDAFPREAA